MNTIRIHALALMMVMSASMLLAEDWSPPDNPDPQAILTEAQADARAMKYERALAKHLWFHENALKLNPGMSGVRLSFALSAWARLGREYPPAMAKLEEIRNALEERAKQGEEMNADFHDLAAINRTLGDESRTTEAFKSLDTLNPGAAKRAFHFVKPALIKDEEYELYVKFVNPKRDFLQVKHVFELNKQMAEDPRFGRSLLDHANKSFRNSSATLVAILAVNSRQDEASEIATLAKQELDDPQFHKELDAALEGTVPAPWP